jgi:hypothetical protein
MKSVGKPWIAYKVMAAGAIPADKAFRYACLHGADFVLAGMFDFEIAEDARLCAEAVERNRKRGRSWYPELEVVTPAGGSIFNRWGAAPLIWRSSFGRCVNWASTVRSVCRSPHSRNLRTTVPIIGRQKP